MAHKIQFHKLTYNRREEDWVAAYEPTGSYALVDETGKELIEYLENHSLEQAKKVFSEYDVEDFVDTLTKKGLVHKQASKVVDHKKHLADLLDIPKKYLRWTQHPITTGITLGVVLTGIYFLLTQPHLVPAPSWFYATPYYSLLIPLIILTMLVISTLHELGHYATLKATGHTTGIHLMHRWYFLRPRVNLNNAQLLTKQARTRVYLAGLAVNGIILTTALLFVALTNHPYAKLVALLSFLHALSQFTPSKEADLMRVASHQAGVDDITSHFTKALKSMCIFCKQKDDFHRHAAPLLILSSLVLATILLVYALPFIGAVTIQSMYALLSAAALNYQPLFVDSLITLLIISITAAFSATAQLQDHPRSHQPWFRALMTALFGLSTFTAALLISVALTTYAQPPTALATHLVLGVLYGALLINYTQHFKLSEYHVPALALITATLLLTTLFWYSAAALITAPIATYAVMYSVGVLASTLL